MARGPRTASEHLAELEADPAWVAAREKEDAARRKQEAEWRETEAPLAKDLREVGLEVDSAWDLVNTSRPYAKALPILLDHLQRPYPDRLREGMARALAVRGDAKFAWDALLRLYLAEESGTDAKDGLAVALAAICDKEVVDDLAEVAKDRRHGESRILLITAFRRLRAREVVEELSSDPELATEIDRLRRRST